MSQNGMKFRSICRHCNNNLLGSKYDPSLNEFGRKVARTLRAAERLTLPARVDVEYEPQRLARAVIGHLLAAEIRPNMMDRPENEPMLDAMRSYFLDEAQELPPELNLYFWSYPAPRQTILRGLGLLCCGHTILGDFLKYFPVAFWLTHQVPSTIAHLLTDRELGIRGFRIGEKSILAVPTQPLDTLRPDWPEHPDDQEILAINNDRCFVAEQF